jgi:hypothetical protein
VNTGITDAGTIAGTAYPTFVMGTSGNLPQRVAASSLSFVPSTGRLNATSFAGLWNGTVISGEYGGTGVNNGTKTITLGGDLLTTGSTNSLTLNTTGTTAVTLPASGTLYGTLNNSFNSAALRTSLIDETGTGGSVVFSTNPNLTAPRATSLIGNGTLPTNTPGAGINAVTIEGNDLAGTITLTSDGSVAAGGAILTVIYTTVFPGGSYPVLYPANAATASLAAGNQVYAEGATNNFVIRAGTGTLTGPAVVYKWNYHVIGR